MYSFKDKHPHGDSYCPQCNQLANLYTLCHCAPKCAKCTDQCINDSKLADRDGRCLTCGARYNTVRRKKITYDCSTPKKVLLHAVLYLLALGVVIAAGYVEHAQWKLIDDNSWLYVLMAITFVIECIAMFVSTISSLINSNETYDSEKDVRQVTIFLLLSIVFAALTQCIGVPVLGAFTGKYVPNIVTHVLGAAILFYPAVAIAIVVGIIAQLYNHQVHA